MAFLTAEAIARTRGANYPVAHKGKVPAKLFSAFHAKWSQIAKCVKV